MIKFMSSLEGGLKGKKVLVQFLCHCCSTAATQSASNRCARSLWHSSSFLRVSSSSAFLRASFSRLLSSSSCLLYRAAQRIDQACLANEAFQSVSRCTPSTLTKTTTIRPPPLSVARLPPVLPLLVTLKSPLPAPSMGVPMDIDVTQKARPLSL